MEQQNRVGLAVLMLLLTSVNAWGDNDRPTACEYAAETLYKACRYDVRDNYLTTTASCANISDRPERRDCYDEATEARNEEAAFCGDVAEAREDACDLLEEDRYDPDPLLAAGIDFIHPDDVPGIHAPNPFVSIAAGHTYVLRSGAAGEETVVVHVTDETREILGVACRVIIDIAVEESEDGGVVEYEAIEVTDDWVAQDTTGNLYYCGELARNYEDGILRDLDGSFEAGLDLAKSGVLIRSAFPGFGAAHRQEFALGEAEDIVQYLDGAAVPTDEEGGDNLLFPCAPLGCLRTFDFAPNDPEATEFKYYKPGAGFVLAVSMEDGELTGEREELMCVGDSLDVLADDPQCGIADPDALLDELCRLAPDVYCE